MWVSDSSFQVSDSQVCSVLFQSHYPSIPLIPLLPHHRLFPFVFLVRHPLGFQKFLWPLLISVWCCLGVLAWCSLISLFSNCFGLCLGLDRWSGTQSLILPIFFCGHFRSCLSSLAVLPFFLSCYPLSALVQFATFLSPLSGLSCSHLPKTT